MPVARRQKREDSTDTFVASEFHTPIFEWFQEGGGHLVVEALAGTGKTTTVIKALDYAPEDSILYCAFNKRNQLDLEARITNPKAKAQTINSIGTRAIYRNLRGAWKKMGKDMPGVKPWDRAKSLAEAVTKGAPFGAARLVQELVNYGRELMPVDTTVDGLEALAFQFGLLAPVNSRLTERDVAIMTYNAMEIAATVEPVKTGIDFSDQIFLPLRLGLLQPEYDMVVADEYQDLTGPQCAIIRAVCKSFGRIVLIGDMHQAIYAWRGAGGAGLRDFIHSLEPAVLPLPRTYRCPKSVVRMAQTIVPAFEAGDGAPEGVVDSAKVREVLRDAKEGDFILSRLNAPLAPIAMALLRAQKRAKIAGRKIGLGLVDLTRQVAKNTTTVEAMLSNLKAWEEKQTARLMAKNLAEEVLDLQDRADTLRALAQGADSVEGLVARIDYLFEDDAQGAIILSSVHKAKGLEANRVWVLESTFYIDAKWTNPQEEKNLWYVAITRAKQHLTIVNENEKETVS